MGSPAQEPHEVAPSPPRSRRRRIVVAVVASLGIVLLLELSFAIGMTRDLATGRAALLEARRSLLAGDLDRAQATFLDAENAFRRAVDRSRGPVGTSARWVPFAGNSADTFTAMSQAGVSLAIGGSAVTGALQELPNGIGSLAPSGGRLPLERYADLAAGIDAARDAAAVAVTTLEAVPDAFVPRVLQRARWDALDQTDRLADVLRGTSLLLNGIASFAGEGAPRHYLVVAQNPAELRGTGGIWGAYSILTLAGGRAHVSPARPTQALRDFPAGRVPSPSEDYARNYDQYGGAGSWQNMNATPDFPAAARAALANYELGEGRRLDGVIAADPFALEGLLEVTGPLRVAGIGTIDAGNVVDITTNRAYASIAEPTQRKEVLGTVATTVLGRFLSMDEHGLARLKSLGGAVAQGHLRIYSADADVEAGLAALGVDGALGTPGGDVVAVTVNNGSASKVDYYADRTVDYDVRLGGDGEALATATVTIDNDAPTRGQPRYVIGPFIRGAEPGDQVPLTTVSCHAPCELVAATRDGADIAVTPGTENGVPWLRDYRTIGARDSGTLALTWHATDVWEGNSSAGSYRLTYLGQVTIRPSVLRVTIHAPAGTRIVWTNAPMVIDGGIARWEGTPSSTTQLEVRFAAPMPLRILRNVTRPVLGG